MSALLVALALVFGSPPFGTGPTTIERTFVAMFEPGEVETLFLDQYSGNGKLLSVSADLVVLSLDSTVQTCLRPGGCPEECFTTTLSFFFEFDGNLIGADDDIVQSPPLLQFEAHEADLFAVVMDNFDFLPKQFVGTGTVDVDFLAESSYVYSVGCAGSIGVYHESGLVFATVTYEVQE